MKKKGIIEFIKDIFFSTVGAALYAMGIYSFAVAGNFAPGGISGLAIIINHFINAIPIGVCTLLINIPVVLFTYKTLGKTFFIKSVVSMVIVAVMLDYVFPHLPTYSGNTLLAAMFAGALSGLGLSFIYMRGSSTGGTDFIILALRKKHPHMSIGNITLIIDGCVLLLNGVAFKNIEAVLYGTVLTYTATIFIDKCMYGIGAKKKVSIVTTKGNEISERISNEIGRGSTLINAIGTYTKKDKQLLICICDSRQAVNIRHIAYEIDNEALIYIDVSEEVYGYGFADND